MNLKIFSAPTDDAGRTRTDVCLNVAGWFPWVALFLVMTLSLVLNGWSWSNKIEHRQGTYESDARAIREDLAAIKTHLGMEPSLPLNLRRPQDDGKHASVTPK